MYLQNKYTKIYYNIVDRAKSRNLSKHTYTEKHHIIPRSLGGSNSKNNLVNLTAREHRLCHLLLPKMTMSEEHTRKMWYAAWMILRVENQGQQRSISTGKFYELAKIEFAKSMSKLHKGKILSEETRKKMSVSRRKHSGPNKGIPMKEEQKQKMRDTIAINGRIISPETVKKILESRKNYKHSEETKKKISDGNKGKIRPPCSEEQKRIVSEKLKGRIMSEETKRKMSEKAKGKIMSEETRRKMSEARKAYQKTKRTI